MPPITPQHKRRLAVGFSLVLFLSLATIYGQVVRHSFINFDDNIYLYDNNKVKAGLSLDGFSWALTSTHASNWHPITWLSHMLDCQFFGLNAGFHHSVSVLLHALNAELLFYFLLSTTGSFWPSVFVSLLFALHPLHVESIAWASERKDLLSTFFMLLSLISYSAYSRRSGIWRYCTVALFFVLSLMSKPMTVSFPFLLLLLDYWPLNRIRLKQYSGDSHQKTTFFLICEKIPFFILSGASCLVTFLIQQHSGAVKSLQMIPASLRISNALISYVAYLKKMLYPVDLVILYPFSQTIPLWMSAGAALILLAISFKVLQLKNKHPFLAVGWFWYIVTMIPVIGLVQVGVQSMADRYTYIPLIGIFIMISFEFSKWKKMDFKITWLLPVLVFLPLGVLSWKQIGYWKNSEVLFRHALEVTPKNYTAHNHLAKTLAENGNPLEAEQHYTAVLAIMPSNSEAMANLGVLLAEQGKVEQAYGYLSKAALLEPQNPKIQNNLGNIHKSKGQLEEATAYYKKAIAFDPEYKEALFNLANTLEKQDRFNESLELYQKTITLHPAFAEAFNGIGVTLARSGNLERSLEYFRKALELKPNYLQAQKNLAMATGKINP